MPVPELDLPADWPANARALLGLAVQDQDAEGWTPERLQDAIEGISTLVAEPYLARFVAEAAAQSRSLTDLDAPRFLAALIQGVNHLVLARWRELEELRQASAREPERAQAERLALEPRAARWAPSEVAELRARAGPAPAGSPPLAEGPPPPPAGSTDSTVTQAEPEPAPRLTPPLRPVGEGPPVAWSEVELTAIDMKTVGVKVRGAEWGPLTMPRDGRGSERATVVWSTLFLFLLHEGTLWWEPGAGNTGVVVGSHKGGERRTSRLKLTAFEGRLRDLRDALKLAFDLKERDLLKYKKDKAAGRNVWRAPFLCRSSLVPGDYFPDDYEELE